MSQAAARALVFTASASVLVVEILAVRLVAPYLGISLEVFTGIIGVILAGISLGAWAGGRAADWVEPRRLIGPLLVGGGSTVLASPLLVDLVGPSLSTDPLSVVFAATVGFFVPAALLSALPPVVVKIRLSSLAETGTVVGSYSAIGTAGALFGTFVTGFVLVAAFPTRPVMVTLGSSLAIIGIGLWVAAWKSKALMSVVVAGLAALLLVFDGPCEHETAYHCVIIEADPANPGGRTLLLDRVRNSYVDLDDPTHLEFRYVRLIRDIVKTEAPAGPLTVVSIGGGGFTLPRYFQQTRPGSVNTVLEIDPALVAIGTDELALPPKVEVVADDARVSLRRLPEDSADVVIGDAFSGASVPWHLTTVEFAAEIRRVLKPEGIYVMNVIDYGSLDFARSATATLQAVFEHAAVFAPPSYLSGSGGGNFVLAGADRDIDVSAIIDTIRLKGGVETGLEGTVLDDFVEGSPVLTDDHAPVDQIVGRP